MKPKSVLENLANQYTLPGGAFYMDEQGTIQTVKDIAELKKYLVAKGETQVIYVKSIDRFVESDPSGVADEVTSWASTHPKRKGYRWVLQAVATAASSVAPYLETLANSYTRLDNATLAGAGSGSVPAHTHPQPQRLQPLAPLR